MSKALVIAGANFLANKLDTVELDGVIPCTGISLSQSTITFSDIGDTASLVTTLTPSNTTDNVVWESSDSDVATVENGTVTCVGIGSCTITAMCGTQSATCSVSLSSITFDLSDYAKVTGYRAQYNNDYATAKAQTYGYLYASTSNVLDGYKLFYGESEFSNTYYPIPIPKGATKVSATSSNNALAISVLFFDSQTPSEYRPSSSAAYSAKRVGRKAGTGSFATYDFSSLNTDGFLADSYRSDTSSAGDADLNATLTIVFS